MSQIMVLLVLTDDGAVSLDSSCLTEVKSIALACLPPRLLA